MKRFMSLLLCICLAITMLPAGAFAKEGDSGSHYRL